MGYAVTMRQRIIDFIKHNRIVYFLYNRLGSLFVRFVGLFVPVNSKKILFVSFGGKKYDDSPRSVYERMITMPEFKDYEFVWAFIDTKKEIKGNAKIIKIDSFSYFIHALSSKFWIVNVSSQRGLSFKRKKNICINTWHGTPLKKIYGEENENAGRNPMAKPEKFDLVCAQSEYDKEIFARIFRMNPDDIIISDLPRNDSLLRYSEEDKSDIRRKLGISDGKKIILYMPTYREYTRDSHNACLFLPPMNLAKWKEKLGGEYVLLFRAHYLVVKKMDITPDDFVREVSAYPCLSELYAISDIMISDYSSAFFDYAVLERPELCFAYDLEEYSQKRGLYLDMESELPCSIDRTEDEVIEHILALDYDSACERTRKFKEKYTPNAGRASELVTNEILERFM